MQKESPKFSSMYFHMSCFTALVVRSKAFSLSCTTSAPGKGNVYMKRVR